MSSHLQRALRIPRHSVRCFSTPAPPAPPTAEQLAEYEEKAKRQVNYLSQSTYPKTMTDVMGSGRELSPPKNPAEIAVFSGMPAEHASRTVIIAPRPTKTLQSGDKYSHQWTVTWKNKDRWSNPLMGWTSTADPMSNVKLTFDSSEDAIAYATKNGWKFELRAPTSEFTVTPGTYSYSHNFLPTKTTILVKKGGLKNKVFANAGYGKSNWFMPLQYHGDKEVEQFGPPSK